MIQAPRREFKDGHKTLNAAEAKALQELLKSERDKRKFFEENKHRMIKARNPLVGEITPRDGMGEPIINPNHTNSDHYKKKPKELTEKIGINSNRYNCLGNITSRTQPKDTTHIQELETTTALVSSCRTSARNLSNRSSRSGLSVEDNTRSTT
jgi:hypothetical protein